MKVNSGVTRDLVLPGPSRTGSMPRAANRTVRECPPAAAGRSRHRHGRAGTSAWLAAAASALLIGCAALPAGPWRVEPMFRLENGNTSAAAGYLALARQYEGESRVVQALDAYRKAAQAAPTDPDVLNLLGLALARYAQFGPAVAALRQAVALAPERAQLLNNLGYALLLDGRRADARAILRLTLAVEPTHEMASRNLAYVDQQLAAAAASRAATQVAAPQPAPLPEPEGVAAPAPVQAAPMPPPPHPAGSAAQRPATPSAGAATHVSTVAPARPSLDGVSIEIVNGNGINGAAARLRQLLRERGVEVRRLSNRLPYDSPRTLVLYRSGMADAAQAMAHRMPVNAVVGPAPAGSTNADLSVLLGHDIRYAANCAWLEACGGRPERLASTDELQLRVPGAAIGTRR